MLKSQTMSLTGDEHRWLPWTGKLAMRWGTTWNRHRYDTIEQTFESFAQTRVGILMDWTVQQWSYLDGLARELAGSWPEVDRGTLQQLRQRASDFSEIFVADTEGRVMRSSHDTRDGAVVPSATAPQKDLTAPLLHGPYSDPVTLALGLSSSRFHGAMTLMFYQPVSVDGRVVGVVCGRVPNDVLGDLIQREAGHIFHESGDNYLFMVKPVFNPSIRPGTALSRSRFEDNAFTHGENLKDGVRTDYGMVRVQQHTELELVFNDPATGRLETIRRGENLFVTYPGYADYRHIPVIGKGVTFRPVSARLKEATHVLRSTVEDGGNLLQRLPRASGRIDETMVLGQWANSFIDNLEQMIRLVGRTSGETNRALQAKSVRAGEVTTAMQDAVGDILSAIREQLVEIDAVSSGTQTMIRPGRCARPPWIRRTARH